MGAKPEAIDGRVRVLLPQDSPFSFAMKGYLVHPQYNVRFNCQLKGFSEHANDVVLYVGLQNLKLSNPGYNGNEHFVLMATGHGPGSNVYIAC